MQESKRRSNGARVHTGANAAQFARLDYSAGPAAPVELDVPDNHRRLHQLRRLRTRVPTAAITRAKRST